MNYQPINYSKWDFSGKGVNIIPLLTKQEEKIWYDSLPYQDKRNDIGHAEIVTYFSIKLLEYLKGIREIIVPAAIEHDIGWSQLSKTELDLFADKNRKRYSSILRARHQEEGIDLSKKILIKQNYPQPYTPHILEIISQHDTRKGFYSLEDGIVRDSDKLFRFTNIEFNVITKKRKNWNMSIEDIIKRAEGWLNKDGFFYSNVSKKIARIELDNTINS